MRKIVLLFLLLAIEIIAFSQEITVRFTGLLNGVSYCRLDSVAVTNLTRNWTETVEYPDTIIVLGGTVGTNLNIAATQGLGQNIPNPFDCETRVELSVSQRENVRMQLLDASGKQYADYRGSLDAGVHTFDISAAAPQTYVLNATVGSRSYSIRMVNMGSGCGSSIKYAGISGSITAKLTTYNEFQNGDNMRYVGYTTIGGQVVESEAIEQTQVVSQYVTLNFTHYSRPVVETLAATDITTTSATLRGNITSNGGAAVTSRGFYWGTAADNLSQILSSGSGNGEYSKVLSGLTVATTYYYCAFATNSAGTAIGEVMSFTLLDIVPPTVQTNAASNITITSATLSGNVTSDGGATVTSRGFLYGTNSSNLTQNVQSGSGTGSFTKALTGLTSGTTYYYKAYATNSAGTAYGEVMSFTSLEIVPPTVQTNEATNITYTEATLNGNVISDGNSAVTDRGFVYGTSASSLTQDVQSGNGTGSFTKTLTGLSHSTTYYYKAYATNAIGTSYGELKQFTTSSPTMPTVQTNEASVITTTGATLNGNVTSDGGATVTARGFLYGTSVNNLTEDVQSGSGTGSFTKALTGLSSSTTYYYKAYATNSVGTAYGEVRTFGTLAPITGTLNGHEWVDLGLPSSTLWATCNVGASSPTGYGSYFAWGETSGKTTYNSSTYTYTANPTTLPADADVATIRWGADWRMPTRGEMEELVSYCTVEWTTQNGVNGCLFTGPNGNSVFMPAAGQRYGSELSDGGSKGFYWSCSRSSYTSYAWGLYFGSGGAGYPSDVNHRYWGQSVRPVCGGILPTVTTGEATGITATSATLSGNVTSDGNVISDGGETVTARGFKYGTDANNLAQTIQTSSGIGSYTCRLSNLTDGTTYYYKAYATCRRGTAYGEVLSFTTPYLPTVTTGTASSITSTSATLSGNVTSDGGFAVTERGFMYGTDANNLTQDVRNGSGTGSYTYYLSNLTDGTTYYYKAYATSSVGTAYGEVLSFTTPTLPTVTTDTASNITTSSATLSGNVTSDGGATVTERGFVYGTSENDLSQTVISGDGTGSFTADLIDLTPLTTYYYKAYATNSVGTAYGEVMTFTINIVPTVQTDAASRVTAISATLSGNVTFDGGATVTARGFVYGTSANNLSRTVQSGSGTGSFTGTLTGLASVTTYYYKAYATNSVGTSYGEVMSFTTLTLYPPTVTTGSVSNLTGSGASLSGNVTSDGNATVTARGFMYGTDADNLTQTVQSGSGTGSFTKALSGLLPSTTYYYKAYATNAAGTSYGEVRSFTTKSGFSLLNGQVWVDLGLPSGRKWAICNVGANSPTENGDRFAWGETRTKETYSWSTYRYCNGSSSTLTKYCNQWSYGNNSFTDNLTTLQSSDDAATANWGTNWRMPTETEIRELINNSTHVWTTQNGVNGWLFTGPNGNSIFLPARDNTMSNMSHFWSSSLNTNSPYEASTLYFYSGGISTSSASRCIGHPVRPVCMSTNPGGSEVTLPTVTTSEVSNITATEATLSGNVTSAGGLTVTDRGFIYGTSASELTQTVQSGSGTGSFTASLTGLTASTTYYYKAYATNIIGTSYGEVMQFTTSALVVPTVQTISATSITSDGVTLTGNITSVGGAIVTDRGFIYGTSESELTQTVQSGSGAGSFTESLTGLTASTTYYYKAYATNSIGTSYGEVMQFTTSSPIVPTVQTLSVTSTSITHEGATLNGNVTSDGGVTVTDRGFMYGTSESSLTQTIQCGSGTGNFIGAITGLTESTKYYYKAYATNSEGTSYGETNQFRTKCPCGGSHKVSDYEGNQYSTVRIGEQCWMAQNLKSTRFANGAVISSSSLKYPNDNSSNLSTYGYLYNWTAAMHSASSSSDNPSGVQGICPNGWHLPSVAEWNQLINYLSSQSEYLCGDDSANIAKSLASTTNWYSSTNTCAVGNTPTSNNSTGFGAMPAGYYNSGYRYFRQVASFWSSTERDYGSAYMYNLGNTSAGVRILDDYKNSYFGSVRCVKDESSTFSPSVTTSNATSITATRATLYGNITFDGGATVTARGFLYGTNSSNLTQTVQSGSGTGSFSANLTGLTSGTTYYYKAYATNSEGTAYGEVMSFTTPAYDYSEPTGYVNGYGYVDLGLPSGTLWATCNVGASSPEGYGDYYAWGETSTKETYNWDTYIYGDGSNFTKYSNSDGLTTLQSSDDAATANWGAGWRMPTQTEMQELINNCAVTMTTQNGVNGRLFIGPNGNSIFLPSAGFRSDSYLSGDGSWGTYWSSSLYTDMTTLSSAWSLEGSNSFRLTSSHRRYGQSVRPVCQP